MLSKSNKKISASVLAVLASAAPLMAATAEERTIVNAILGIVEPIGRIGGAATLLFGLLWGAYAYANGDDEKWESAGKAVAGGLGMLLVMTVANLLIKASGVGTALH